MRLVPLLAGIVAFSVSCALAAAGEPASKPARKAKSRPASPALDKRVAEAATVFVGEGMRIYFVDRQYREVPYIRAAGEGTNKSAMVMVKVVKVLYPPDAAGPERILVPIETSKDVFGDGRSPYDKEAERHVGKQGIWFGEIVVRKDYGDDKTGRRPLEEPVTLLLPRSADAKRKAAADPLPIKQLKEVEASINRVKVTKQVPAKEARAEIQASKNDLGDKHLNKK